MVCDINFSMSILINCQVCHQLSSMSSTTACLIINAICKHNPYKEKGVTIPLILQTMFNYSHLLLHWKKSILAKRSGMENKNRKQQIFKRKNWVQKSQSHSIDKITNYFIILIFFSIILLIWMRRRSVGSVSSN